MGQSKNIDGVNVLSALVGTYTSFITYVPLRTEVPFQDLYTPPSTAHIVTIAPRASLDPKAEALRSLQTFGEERVCIFLPGRAFDALGTRHGQGGGWYDRFLERLPTAWLRVGFCFADQFSLTPLPRQSWDQVVDVVCVVERLTQTLSTHETNARI